LSSSVTKTSIKNLNFMYLREEGVVGEVRQGPFHHGVHGAPGAVEVDSLVQCRTIIKRIHRVV